MIKSLQAQSAEHGRIRLGVKAEAGKGKKGRPVTLKTFRFTSHDSVALGQIAAIYGGEVRSWDEPSSAGGQFEVITESDRIRVAVPPNALGDGPWMEMWSEAGMLRRCDEGDPSVPGESGCRLIAIEHDEVVESFVPCLCLAEGVLRCKPKTRLALILPEINFGGVWRMDSGSGAVARTMPAMIGLLEQLQVRGLAGGVLTLQEQKSVKGGRTRRFTVPRLVLDHSIDAIAAGTPVAIGVRHAARAIEAVKVQVEDDVLPVSDETWAWLRAECAALDDEQRERLKTYAAGLGESLTRNGLSEAGGAAVALRAAEIGNEGSTGPIVVVDDEGDVF
jgi:Recombination directionality factor-like